MGRSNYHYFFKQMLPSSSGRPRIVAAQSKALKRNKHRPRIVAAGSKRGTCRRVQMISDDGHHASAWTVRVVQVVRTAVGRTEGLCVVLTASSNRHRLTLSSRHVRPKSQSNKHRPRIVTALE